jgi:hypothetical protein
MKPKLVSQILPINIYIYYARTILLLSQRKKEYEKTLSAE